MHQNKLSCILHFVVKYDMRKKLMHIREKVASTNTIFFKKKVLHGFSLIFKSSKNNIFGNFLRLLTNSLELFQQVLLHD